MYKLYIRFYSVPGLFTSVVIAASWWRDSGWTGIRYKVTLSLAASFVFMNHI